MLHCQVPSIAVPAPADLAAGSMGDGTDGAAGELEAAHGSLVAPAAGVDGVAHGSTFACGPDESQHASANHSEAHRMRPVSARARRRSRV